MTNQNELNSIISSLFPHAAGDAYFSDSSEFGILSGKGGTYCLLRGNAEENEIATEYALTSEGLLSFLENYGNEFEDWEWDSFAKNNDNFRRELSDLF